MVPTRPGLEREIFHSSVLCSSDDLEISPESVDRITKILRASATKASDDGEENTGSEDDLEEKEAKTCSEEKEDKKCEAVATGKIIRTSFQYF